MLHVSLRSPTLLLSVLKNTMEAVLLYNLDFPLITEFKIYFFLSLLNQDKWKFEQKSLSGPNRK